MALTTGMLPGNIVYPRVRAWIVRVKGTTGNPAFGSTTPSQSGTIDGSRFAAVSNPINESASTPVFERVRLLSLDGKIRELKWEWNRFGGCGAFSAKFFLDRLTGYWNIKNISQGQNDDKGTTYPNSGLSSSSGFGNELSSSRNVTGELFLDDDGDLVTLSTLVRERYEIEIEVDNPAIQPATPNWQTVYRGTVKSARVLSANRSGIVYYFSGYGLVQDLQKLLVGQSWEYYATGVDYSCRELVAEVIVNHVITRSRILWNPAKVSISSDYSLSNFYAENSCLRTIQTLAFLQHRVEWGVDMDGEFYFMDENKEIPPWGVGLNFLSQNCAAIDRELKNNEAPTHVTALGYDGGVYVFEGEALDTSKCVYNQGTHEKIIQVPELIDDVDLERISSNYVKAAWEGYGSNAMNLAVRVIQHEVFGFLETSLPMKRGVLDDDMHGESVISFIDSIEYQVGVCNESVLSGECFDVDVAQGYGLTGTYVLGRGYYSLAQQFELRDQPIQALTSRNRQKRFPRYKTTEGDLPDGNFSGDMIIDESDSRFSTALMWLYDPYTQAKGWYRFAALSDSLANTQLIRNVVSTGSTVTSVDPSAKTNEVAYFSQEPGEDSVLHYSTALPKFCGNTDLAVVVVPRFSLPYAMDEEDNNTIFLKFKFVTVAVGSTITGHTFQERNMQLTIEDLSAYSIGELIQRFGWVLFNRDIEEDSEFQFYFGRYGTDTRDNYIWPIEMYSPRVVIAPMRVVDAVGAGIVDASRVGYGTSADPYFTDFAGLLGTSMRRA